MGARRPSWMLNAAGDVRAATWRHLPAEVEEPGRSDDRKLGSLTERTGGNNARRRFEPDEVTSGGIAGFGRIDHVREVADAGVDAAVDLVVEVRVGLAHDGWPDHQRSPGRGPDRRN